jgi:hypothetical protein
MSISTLQLLTCPFCPDELGEISLNAVALQSLPVEVLRAGHLKVTRDPGEATFVFNSPSAEPGPCEHLLYMTGTCEWRPGKKKRRRRCDPAMSFDWSHEKLLLKQSWNDEIEEYISWLESGPQMGWDPPLPNTERCEMHFHREWPAMAGAQRYEIEGRAMFVDGAAAFCDEVLALIPRFQAILKRTDRNPPVDEHY